MFLLLADAPAYVWGNHMWLFKPWPRPHLCDGFHLNCRMPFGSLCYGLCTVHLNDKGSAAKPQDLLGGRPATQRPRLLLNGAIRILFDFSALIRNPRQPTHVGSPSLDRTGSVGLLPLVLWWAGKRGGDESSCRVEMGILAGKMCCQTALSM